jgi:hypothetical protein
VVGFFFITSAHGEALDAVVVLEQARRSPSVRCQEVRDSIDTQVIRYPSSRHPSSAVGMSLSSGALRGS